MIRAFVVDEAALSPARRDGQAKLPVRGGVI